MDIKREWNSLQGLVQYSQAALDDGALPVHPKTLLNQSLNASPVIPLGGSQAIQLKADCTADLTLFRCAPGGEGTKDPDGVIKGEEGRDSETPPPLITAPVKPGVDCWLKYAVEGKLEETTSVPLLKSMKLAFDATQTLRLCDYRIHSKTAKLAECIQDDMADCRMALGVGDIQNLLPGDAISLRATASLSASVTLSWADVFTSTLGAMGVLLGKAGSIGVKVDSGAKFTASVKVADDFRVAFAGVDDKQVRVAVSKAKTRCVTATGRLGVNVELDLDEAKADSFFAGLFGTDYANLPPTVRQQACKGLLKIAENKISAAFTYEYGRISTDAALFQATLDKSSLNEELRLCFLRGNIEALRPSVVGANSSLRLEQYLRRNTMEEKRSWGFTLGIGPWKMYGKDHREFSRVRSWNIEDRMKVAYVGMRSYKEDELEWGTDYKAEMPRFAAAPLPREPLFSEFEAGFHLRMTRQAECDDETLSNWIDWALLWRVLDETQAVAVKKAFLTELGGACAEATFQITFGPQVTASILNNGQAATSYPHFPVALAAAMPWMGAYPQRQKIESRIQCYTPVWERYLNLPPLAGTTAEWRDRDLKDFDDTRSTLLAFNDLADSLDGNAPRGCGTTILGRTTAFLRGMETLRKGATEPHDQVIPRAFRAMMGMGSQHFLIRALGVYLLDLAEERAALPSVVRSFLVEPSDENDNRRWVYGLGGDPSNAS
jgi:hypothetical protein